MQGLDRALAISRIAEAVDRSVVEGDGVLFMPSWRREWLHAASRCPTHGVRLPGTCGKARLLGMGDKNRRNDKGPGVIRGL